MSTITSIILFAIATILLFIATIYVLMTKARVGKPTLLAIGIAACLTIGIIHTVTNGIVTITLAKGTIAQQVTALENNARIDSAALANLTKRFEDNAKSQYHINQTFVDDFEHYDKVIKAHKRCVDRRITVLDSNIGEWANSVENTLETLALDVNCTTRN